MMKKITMCSLVLFSSFAQGEVYKCSQTSDNPDMKLNLLLIVNESLKQAAIYETKGDDPNWNEVYTFKDTDVIAMPDGAPMNIVGLDRTEIDWDHTPNCFVWKKPTYHVTLDYSRGPIFFGVLQTVANIDLDPKRKDTCSHPYPALPPAREYSCKVL